MVDYKTDFDSKLLFKDGDIMITRNEDNLVQTICNRLNTMQDSLGYFYNDYGSIFPYFLGWRKNSDTFNFMKTEIESTLKKDNRINNCNAEIRFEENMIKIDLLVNHNEEVLLSIDENGLIEV